jgi:hypothetical protein
LGPGFGGIGQLIDVISQSGANDDEGQKDNEDHRQGHQEGGQGTPVAQQSEQPAIKGPARETEHHSPEERRNERAQHEQTASQQYQQDNPADVPLLRGSQLVHDKASAEFVSATPQRQHRSQFMICAFLKAEREQKVRKVGVPPTKFQGRQLTVPPDKSLFPLFSSVTA